MKPMIHARNSAKKYGGEAEEYLPIHDFIDSSASTLADVRHRAILHSTFGCFIVEKVFGTYFLNSDDIEVQVRDVAEDHIIEDLGQIPTVERWLQGMKIEPWMTYATKEKDYEARIHDLTDTPHPTTVLPGLMPGHMVFSNPRYPSMLSS